MTKLIGLAVALVASTAAQAQHRPTPAGRVGAKKPAVPDVVKLAIRAARTLRYSGTRSVEFVSGSDRKTHIEFIIRDGPRSRVWFPSDSPYAGQVIVEKGGKRLHFYPGRDVVETSRARGDDAYARFVKAIKNGFRRRLSVEPGGRVANLRTQQVTVKDESGNVVQRLWIDPKTGMILRRALYDAVGAPVGSYEFQSINYRPKIKPGDFDISRPGAKREDIRDRADAYGRQIGGKAYGIAEGKGYDLASARVLNANRSGAILVLTYRGPRGVLTLFQTKARVNGAKLKRLAAGRYRTHTWKLNGLNFALVGDMDVAELRKAAGWVSAL